MCIISNGKKILLKKKGYVIGVLSLLTIIDNTLTTHYQHI